MKASHMTEAKASLRQIKWIDEQVRAAITLARYRARKIIAEQYRCTGRKLASVGMRQWHADAKAYFRAYRAELIAQAQIDLPKATRLCGPGNTSAGSGFTALHPGLSCQFGLPNAPMMPQLMHTIRGPKAGTGTSSAKRSTFKMA
jgi:hypothetical protein